MGEMSYLIMTVEIGAQSVRRAWRSYLERRAYAGAGRHWATA